MGRDKIIVSRWQSPFGEMIIGCNSGCLCLCDWYDNSRRTLIDKRLCRVLKADYTEGTSPVIKRTIKQLEDYFAGKRTTFGVSLMMVGTEFQRRVWEELLRIPYGMTASYAMIARRIGNVRAVRAVAMACATNPISIIVPCHRVIGSDKRLTGYGGGLRAKDGLLGLESPGGRIVLDFDDIDIDPKNLTFRKADKGDAKQIWAILQQGVAQHLRNGKKQWSERYPTQGHVQGDIRAGVGHVLTHRGKVVAYGAVVADGEPEYERLDGTWLTNGHYIVVHRLAVSDTHKQRGVATEFMRRAEQYAQEQGIGSMKVDTNYDNDYMLRMLQRLGYERCGTVRYPQGTRIAFEKVL